MIISFIAGVIKTALPKMDRENREQYQVVIQAKDMGGQMGGLSGTTLVNITLSDVNDNPPRFPQSKNCSLFIFSWTVSGYIKIKSEAEKQFLSISKPMGMKTALNVAL